MVASNSAILVRGARVHNLKHVNVDIPRDQLVVITGPSGSGKSSLAFDTLHAEGQRQYLETLSPFVRQQLPQMERADVDAVDGLPPTICIDQHIEVAHPRSTVGTITEIYDYLRLLMARLGTVYCHLCGTAIGQQSLSQIQERLAQFTDGTKLMILAPMVRGRRGAHRETLAQIRKAGLIRARINGNLHDLETLPELTPSQLHDIDAVVDRVVVRTGLQSRLDESVRLAAEQGDGRIVAFYSKPEDPTVWHEELFNTRYACPDCQEGHLEIEPRTFSFNSPYGVCPACEGGGKFEEFDRRLAIPDFDVSFDASVLLPWRKLPRSTQTQVNQQLAAIAKGLGLDPQVPLQTWNESQRERLWTGDGEIPGVKSILEQEWNTVRSTSRKEQLSWFRRAVPCPSCDGSRLRAEARFVKICGLAIHEITRLTLQDAIAWFDGLRWTDQEQPIATPIVRNITNRLMFLNRVGVDYLSLDRTADTLSGGEMQRVRLATGIGSGLVGVCYILDEPSVGLHPRDNDRLISAIRELQTLGNTVVVVEHDLATMRTADYLIDLGPEAGEGGGYITAAGTPVEVEKQAASLTGQYLSGLQSVPVPGHRRAAARSRSLLLEGASLNNLDNVTVRFPLGTLTCVTGVSGSGKSSLVNDTLAPALLQRTGVAAQPGPYVRLTGAEHIDKVVCIDQQAIGRSPRSNPATYSGVFDEVRKVYATTRDARQRGYAANRFSFNVPGGRCEACQGQGMQKYEMHFLPDLYVECDQCHGTRFNAQTLQVRYRDKSIADVLKMRVLEAREFFTNFAPIARSLEAMVQVGLGYLPLGQSSTTLSGGESQRIKLATELSRVDTGKTVYILDEPTTGLHIVDIQRLLSVLQQLVDKGNTVIIVEHHLDVIKSADWVIDLGPDGGSHGGKLIAEGTPETVAQNEESITGRYLRELLKSN
ncbi:MAG: excinuclease ABC subunit UvrA [Planctomycetota bacterium]|nr:excinuclease ABC subunit UvrA [Planctomycetota bacterium]MDA1177178.1 excinuclease ABC subunit UvrA [Planctomycetota bacterium]